MSMSECDGTGNIVRCIDFSCKKEYNYECKLFDELQLGTDFVSRQFAYHAGQVAIKTKSMPKKTLFLEHRSVYEKVVFYRFNSTVCLYRFIIM